MRSEGARQAAPRVETRMYGTSVGSPGRATLIHVSDRAFATDQWPGKPGRAGSCTASTQSRADDAGSAPFHRRVMRRQDGRTHRGCRSRTSGRHPGAAGREHDNECRLWHCRAYRRREASRSNARTSPTPCGSQSAGRVVPVVLLCLCEQCIKLPSRRIGFELTVPGSGVEVNEPAPELGKSRRRQSLHGFFKSFHVRHGGLG